jgi:DNA repair exonuclease SbcCD ATPase subunit
VIDKIGPTFEKKEEEKIEQLQEVNEIMEEAQFQKEEVIKAVDEMETNIEAIEEIQKESGENSEEIIKTFFISPAGHFLWNLGNWYGKCSNCCRSSKESRCIDCWNSYFTFWYGRSKKI